MSASPTPRRICLELLNMTEKSGSYSNIALDAALKKYPGLRPIDRRFISALYYGVIERKITLDAVIESLSARPSERLAGSVRQILRMGIYQILYMDSVPESAAVNESTALAKQEKNPAAAGFVNAVLRNFLRSGCKLPKSGVKYKDLSVEYSVPEWIVRLWESDYGADKAAVLLKNSLGPAPVTSRLNTLHYSLEEIEAELKSDGATLKKNPAPVENCYDLSGCGAVEELGAYKKGMLHIQDASCQLCCAEVDPKPGETVLDLCSAPGGKAFTLAEKSGDKAFIYAYDLHKNRVGLISSGAKRLGLCGITAAVNDAKVYSAVIPKADKILCDVPCSGLGVIRRKPDIKYRAQEDVEPLPEIQLGILKTSSRYLKPGGILIYSTCTLRRAENEDIAEKFLKDNPGFEPVKLSNFTSYSQTITQDMFGSDGFFIAKFRKISEKE